MATVLITGGAGFIGSNTADLLIEEGYDIIVVDDLSNGKKENVNPKAKFYKIDVTSDKLAEVFKKEKPKFVIHLATQISVPKSVEDPIFDAKAAILGTLNVLENCRKHDIKKIIFSSSAAKYGNPVELPINEEHPCNPLSQYGVSKRAVELYLAMYNRLYCLDYNALVYSNAYGPRQDTLGEAGVIAIFIDNILKGKKCTIFGDGKATRDYVYVKDVAKANLLALKKVTKKKVINIGTGVKITVNELFEKISSVMAKGEAEHGAERPGDIRDSYFDVKLAKKELKWEPETGFEEGLKETVAWFYKKT